MLLAIDTATRWTGLALYDGVKVVAELGWYGGRTQTIELAPTVAQMWQRAGTTAAELSGIAVALGPGSYTGLRVGLGFAKGLAFVQKIPMMGVSTMDIIAASMGRFPGLLGVVAEAGRKRVCVAYYLWDNRSGWQSKGEPIVATWAEVLAEAAPKTTFVGEISTDGVKLMRQAGKQLKRVTAAGNVRRAAFLAELGWRRLQENDVDDAQTLAPIYMRDPAGK